MKAYQQRKKKPPKKAARKTAVITTRKKSQAEPEGGLGLASFLGIGVILAGAAYVESQAPGTLSRTLDLAERSEEELKQIRHDYAEERKLLPLAGCQCEKCQKARATIDLKFDPKAKAYK